MNDQPFTQEQAQEMFGILEEIHTSLVTLDAEANKTELSLYETAWKHGIERFYEKNGITPTYNREFEERLRRIELIDWIRAHETDYHFQNLEDRTIPELVLIKQTMLKNDLY